MQGDEEKVLPSLIVIKSYNYTIITARVGRPKIAVYAESASITKKSTSYLFSVAHD